MSQEETEYPVEDWPDLQQTQESVLFWNICTYVLSWPGGVHSPRIVPELWWYSLKERHTLASLGWAVQKVWPAVLDGLKCTGVGVSLLDSRVR